jgi:hypothetical protein
VSASDSPDAPDRPPGRGLVDALNVPRNAAVGAVVGLLLAVAMYAFRVLELVGPFPGTQQFPVLGPAGWFLLLAFVLASATALLVALALTVVSAYRLSRTL